ncbi:uncharacterized protein BDZ99DRAFT_14641 [Mytilinidion resinicola]|uniref:Uncharacterized protein n=1 Tax=Mytilinidion resinicola TaxID=574789 RepID=A0A6A6Z9H2_9PEZI|nr:uncharacterized protein BDZ99DRAFT_14641 [Mytilinidion resinicola]KAF2817383.1 hypothetical protein BDZ99DRAFT_14641 [Mytilinidion resinicola]
MPDGCYPPASNHHPSPAYPYLKTSTVSRPRSSLNLAQAATYPSKSTLEPLPCLDKTTTAKATTSRPHSRAMELLRKASTASRLQAMAARTRTPKEAVHTSLSRANTPLPAILPTSRRRLASRAPTLRPTTNIKSLPMGSKATNSTMIRAAASPHILPSSTDTAIPLPPVAMTQHISNRASTEPLEPLAPKANVV